MIHRFRPLQDNIWLIVLANKAFKARVAKQQGRLGLRLHDTYIYERPTLHFAVHSYCSTWLITTAACCLVLKSAC